MTGRLELRVDALRERDRMTKTPRSSKVRVSYLPESAEVEEGSSAGG